MLYVKATLNKNTANGALLKDVNEMHDNKHTMLRDNTD